ncbi:MAG: SPOR domain-containing protein [Bacteroidetes bacterium]|nr:SPOR domain-containing protein [Bacteroidota bacterium]
MAQGTAPDIQQMVAQVNAGAGESVREQLPSLISKYPNHPGVMYLQALLTREGADAVRTYQGIVDNFPSSEWADDALYKVYQFYYALGLYRTAELKMTQLRTSYPASPFGGEAAGAAQGARPSLPTPDPLAQQPATVVSTPPETHTSQEPGVAETSAEPPPQTSEQPSEATPVSPQPHSDAPIPVRFSLQVGAFTLHANAETQKARFESQGYPAEMVSKVRDTRSLFIVLVGDYATYEEAKGAAAAVKKKMGIDAIVISR